MCKGKPNPSLKPIEFDELKRHNKFDDAWLAVHGTVYNVTEWAKKHPGGDIILLGAGTDSTVMFESYHPKGVASAILDKYAIGRVVNAPPSFYDWSGELYPTIRDRVAKHFADKQSDFRGGLLPKAVVIMALFSLGFWTMLFGEGMWGWVGAVVWGLAATHIGLAIMHDGNHGAFSTIPAINKVAGWGMDLIGASGLVWEFQHVVGHHQYTNLQTDNGNNHETDPDTMSSYPLVRMHRHNKRSWYNKYQHIYAPIMFGLMTLSKVFMADVESVWRNAVMHISMEPRLSNKLYVVRFYGMKVATLGVFLGLPVYYKGKEGLALYVVAHLICSFYLAICFIVNHISESCSFFVAGEKPMNSPKQAEFMTQQVKAKQTVPENDWAATQIRGCVNWASGSTFWNHFSGGLNHQVEHHLFPSVCHIHYPAISKIVRQTCAEFGVPYLNHPTFSGAYFDMINHLRILGHTD